MKKIKRIGAVPTIETGRKRQAEQYEAVNGMSLRKKAKLRRRMIPRGNKMYFGDPEIYKKSDTWEKLHYIQLAFSLYRNYYQAADPPTRDEVALMEKWKVRCQSRPK